MYYAAREEHLEWLKKQLAKEEAELVDAEARVIELRGSVAYYKHAIEQLSPTASHSDSSLPNNSQQGDTSSSEESNSRQVRTNLLPEGNLRLLGEQDDDDDFADNDFEEGGDSGFEEGGESKRNPKDMLKPNFKGKTLGEIAELFLNHAKGRSLKPEFIAQNIFEFSSEEEFQRAKNSLATELRRGAREGRWEKHSRGRFRANPSDTF